MYALVRLVRPMTLNSARVVEEGLRAFDLTVGMRAILEVVSERGASTVPQIAETLDVSRQAAQRLVDGLLSRGYVETVTNPRHRRSRLVEATARGAEVFASVRAAEMEQLRALAPEASPADLETALRVLTAVARDIRRNASKPSPGPHADDLSEAARG